MFLKVNKRVLYTFISFLIVISGTIVAIQYANGSYHITDKGFVGRSGSGLLSASSLPTGGEVYINDKLVTATPDRLYLEPGNYQISITKDGYTTWKKTVSLKEKVVTETNAKLFPIAPSLTRLTFTGISNIAPSPDGQKILYYTASQSASQKNGLYVLSLSNNNAISFDTGPKQIAEDVAAYKLGQAKFIWSPDSTEVMVLTDAKEMVLPIDKMSDVRTLPDISFKKKQMLSEWEADMYVKEREFLGKFPPEVIEVATQSAKNVYISPDKKRLLYTATKPTTLPDHLVPAIPGTNSQPQQRTLQPGSIYVYDREEDRNFKIAQEPKNSQALPKQLLATDLYNSTARTLLTDPTGFSKLQATASAQTVANFDRYYSSLYTETLQWFPDSTHLFFVQDNAVKIAEYDGTNVFSLYAGPFEHSFVYPWPDGSRILITTSFSPGVPPNLYAIELK